MSEELDSQFAVPNAGEVSSILLRPADARWLLVLGHGAGAGMRHPFMTALSRELGAEKIATFRYQFPYMENRRKAPDRPPTLTATVAAAVQAAHSAAPELPLLAGGKSMGGRMTSTAASESLIPEVRGLVFFGFPLHPPKQPATKRGDHLAKVDAADALSCKGRATIWLISSSSSRSARSLVIGRRCTSSRERITRFHVLKSSGKSDAEILRELAHTTARMGGNALK